MPICRVWGRDWLVQRVRAMGESLAGVVLAAGAGSRLRPLTRLRPKALCPVGDRPLVDHACDRAASVTSDVAVNVHHGRALVEAHLADRPLHLSVEADEARGTAGALGLLRPWIDGRAGAGHQRRRLGRRRPRAPSSTGGTGSASGCCAWRTRPAATSATCATRGWPSCRGPSWPPWDRSRRGSTSGRGPRPRRPVASTSSSTPGSSSTAAPCRTTWGPTWPGRAGRRWWGRGRWSRRGPRWSGRWCGRVPGSGRASAWSTRCGPGPLTVLAR